MTEDTLQKWFEEHGEFLCGVKMRFIIRTSAGGWGKGDTLLEALNNADFTTDQSVIVGLYDEFAWVDDLGTVHYMIGHSDPEALDIKSLK